MLAWISRRDTGRRSTRAALHTSRECPGPRHTQVRAVEVAWFDDARVRGWVSGLGSRRHCAICRDTAAASDGAQDVVESGDMGGGADESGSSGTDPPRDSDVSRVRGPRRAPLPAAVPLDGWISATDAAGDDRHAVHAATECAFARGDAWRRVTVEVTDGPVGVRAGWWHPPAVRCWVPGVGWRRLCRECWQRGLLAAAAQRESTPPIARVRVGDEADVDTEGERPEKTSSAGS